MVSYVVYRVSKEFNNRSAIPRRLKELGCKRIHSAFWKIEEEKVYNVLKVLEKNQPVLLKRTREVKRPKFVRNSGLPRLGSLVIVMYAAPKEVRRERIRKVLKRAPCIRLRRSVYAFSQKHSFFDKDHKLVDARKFAIFVKEIHGDVKVIPRVLIVNRDAVERLLQETRERVERENSDIVRCCKELYGKALKGDDVRLIKDSLSKCKRRFLTVKKVAAFYEKWLNINFSRSLIKSYKAVKKVNSIVSRK